ncbi:NosD domain-containing protein [Elusimicrobiota bacterium]
MPKKSAVIAGWVSVLMLAHLASASQLSDYRPKMSMPQFNRFFIKNPNIWPETALAHTKNHEYSLLKHRVAYTRHYPLGDAVVAGVKTRWVSGKDTIEPSSYYYPGYGMMVSIADDDYYFLIAASGWASFWTRSNKTKREKNGVEWIGKLAPLQKWVRREEINREGVNYLKLEALKGTFRCFVNGLFVFSVRTSTHSALIDEIGFATGHPKVAFDNFYLEDVQLLTDIPDMSAADEKPGPELVSMKSDFDLIAKKKAAQAEYAIRSGLYYSAQTSTLTYWCDFYDKHVTYLPAPPIDSFRIDTRGKKLNTLRNNVIKSFAKFEPVLPFHYPARDAYRYFVTGLSQVLKSDYDQAIKYFSKAIQHDPKFISAYIARARAYEEIMRFLGREHDWRYDGLKRKDLKKIQEFKDIIIKKRKEALRKPKTIAVAQDGSGDYAAVSDIPEAALDPGDIVLIKTGIYHEKIYARSHIKYMAEESVVVGGIDIDNADNVHVQGFAIDLEEVQWDSPQSAITINGSKKVILDRCEINNVTHDDQITIPAILIGGSAGNEDVIVRGCKIFDCDSGIQVHSSKKVRIEENFISNIRKRPAILIGTPDFPLARSSQVVLVNNTIVHNLSGAIYLAPFYRREGENQFAMRNNIVAFNKQWLDTCALYEREYNNTYDVKHNMFFENERAIYPVDFFAAPDFIVCLKREYKHFPVKYGKKKQFLKMIKRRREQEINRKLMVYKSSFEADPGFMDAGNGDYRLKPDSPCIFKGAESIYMGALPPAQEQEDLIDDPPIH